MAMSTGGGKGVTATINVTPMIDVLLVLLIIFLMIPQTKYRGEKALIPQPPNPQALPIDPVRTIVLQVSSEPSGGVAVKINGERVPWTELNGQLHAIFDTRVERVAFVKADKDLDWDQVAQVIDVAHGVGVTNIGLITDTMR